MQLKKLLFGLIIISGLCIVITEKDYTSEMKELESILNENAKLAEERNNIDKNAEANTTEENENSKEADKTDSDEQKKSNINNVDDAIDEEKLAEKVKQLPVVGVGDSVMLTAVDGLYKVFPNG